MDYLNWFEDVVHVVTVFGVACEGLCTDRFSFEYLIDNKESIVSEIIASNVSITYF